MKEIEIQNVMKLIPFERYKYFIKKVADFEELWTIIDINGDYALCDVDDNIMISFWPKSEYIVSNLIDEWKNCKPIKLTLDHLENDIFKIIINEGYLINIFPVNGKSGFVVDLKEFIRDLNDELEKY